MRTLVVLAVLAAGCGGDSHATPDAAAAVDARVIAGDFSCMSTPWPTTAADPLAVSGKVVDSSNNNVAVAGATIEIRANADGSLLGQATSSGSSINRGQYSVSIATGGVAPGVYRKVSATGYLDDYTNDATDLYSTNQYIEQLETAAARDGAYQLVGATADPAKGALELFFYDCGQGANMKLVAGITVDVPPGSAAIYYDASFHRDPSLTETTSAGQVLLVNVPAGPTDISVHAGDLTYRPRQVVVYADAWNESVRLP